MAYRITSPRLGELGAIWEPSEGINVDALIAGGFIEEVGKTPAKSARTKTTTEAPDADQNIEE